MTNKAIEGVKKNVQAGFSLVELMVVVTIIGVLAGIAVPKFQTFRARAAQTEGKSGLNGLYLAQQAYLANYSEFKNIPIGTDALSAAAGIGFSLAGNKAKYDYRLHSVQATNGWAAIATSSTPLGNNPGTAVKTRDAMRINANKWLCSVKDGVTGKGGTLQATGTTALTNESCPEVVADATAITAAVNANYNASTDTAD